MVLGNVDGGRAIDGWGWVVRRGLMDVIPSLQEAQPLEHELVHVKMAWGISWESVQRPLVDLQCGVSNSALEMGETNVILDRLAT